ncbi:plasma membrane associated protein isoform X1 [Zea mays]|uniref:AWPM-19-like family protein n=1 Tax=Zea mays TaxID=4577 RepID=A0A1D6N0I3_MAIZE|nr:plasma membrane associated protein isoform X1 [Zea mays]ONM34302.1 AWPM-19-like family protein [Zea mays]|eukprot:XP_020405401.1 plasma membrane associated protein isoform X1 [Zea mays]
MVLLSLEALRKRNVAGPLLLFNLALYVSMLGFASWALNAFVDHIGDHQYYDPPAGDACTCMDTHTPAGAAPRSAGDEAMLHFLQFALLAAVLGSAAKAAAAFHARALWRPQGLAAAAALGTVAWAATALALGLACKEMRAAAAAARGWQMRTLEAVTAVLAVTQLAYVLMLHRAAAAAYADDEADATAYADAGGDQCEPGCSIGTEDDADADCQRAQQQQHGRHHHQPRQGGGPSCSVM